MNLGNLARLVTVVAACAAGVGSATSNSSNPPAQPQTAQTSPPPPQDMDSGRALGLWRSTFGAVKIEADNTHGGIQSGALHGVWQYQRQGQDVTGYFFGTLRGNVLQFRWQEPANPPLTGEGYLVFEQTGRQYSGRWWSDRRDRVGDWNGWRQAGQQQQQGDQYGGDQDAYPRPGQQQQQQPYYPQQQQQPYYPQPQPQPYPQQQPQQQQQQPYYPQQQPQQPPPQQPQQQQPYPPASSQQPPPQQQQPKYY
ncbi:MAG: hypothetical protein ABI678_17860 [Kofleriaceae bacterium]